MATVLVVDDAAYIKKQIASDLRNTEFSIIGEASNGVEAVVMYKKLKPDIVLMDVVMPNKDGVSATAEIMITNREAKVLIMSSVDNELIIVKALEAGAKHFIQKPFDKQKLIKALNVIME